MSKLKDEHDSNSFASFLRLIVMHSPDAEHALARVHEKTGLAQDGGFWYYKARDAPHGCDCWFDLEFFDFIGHNTINIELLNIVCENLDRGRCKHIVQKEQDGENVEDCRVYFSTTLTHAAAAAGNISVVKYLRKTHMTRIYTPSQTGVKPFHLAIIKSRNQVLKYLYDSRNEQKTNWEFFFNEMDLATRDSGTGTLLRFPYQRKYGLQGIADLLMTYDISDVRTLEELIKVLVLVNKDQYLLHALVHLVFNGATDTAMALLSGIQINLEGILNSDKLSNTKWCVQYCQLLVVACVVTDSLEVLQMLIENKVDIVFKTLGPNLLEVANVFRSDKCAAILQSYMTAGINHHLPPFDAHVFVMITDYSGLYRYVEALKNVCCRYRTACADQGDDVNEVVFKPALKEAIARGKAILVNHLLEFGTDINTKFDDETPLSLAFVNSIVNPNAMDLIKCLLYHNPDMSDNLLNSDMSENLLTAAFEYDIGRTENWHTNLCEMVTLSSNLKIHKQCQTRTSQ